MAINVTKTDIEAVKSAVDIYETNIGGGDENPISVKVLSDLKKLLTKMEKSNSNLKIFSALMNGVHTEIVATSSKSKAAKLMGVSVYQLDTYKVDYDESTEGGKIALLHPDTVFKSKSGDLDWFQSN